MSRLHSGQFIPQGEPMRIQNLTAESALKTMHSRPEGLNNDEASARLAEYGKNTLGPHRRVHLARRLLDELASFFAVILWIAAIISLVAARLNHQPEMNTLAVAILGVIVVNAIFSLWQSLKAERALEALERILPRNSFVLRENKWTIYSTETLVPGDVVEIREGDRAGADLRLIESHHLRVDTSHITGESLPSFRNAHPDPTSESLLAKNLVLAGMRIVSGRAHGVVFATGERTEFGKIARLTLSTTPRASPLQAELHRVSRRIAVLAVGAGIVFFLLGWFAGLPVSAAMIFGIGMIVANVPEGLMPTLTLSLAHAAQRMAKRNALIRHLSAVEALGSTTVICTDKTGTLTLNHLRVKELDWQDQTISAETWQGLSSGTQTESAQAFTNALFLTHSLGSEALQKHMVGDPIEVALVTFARPCARVSAAVKRWGEIPFDDTRRRQSVIVEIEELTWLFCKGAPEVIVNLCSGRADGTDFNHGQLLSRAEAYAQRGLKVLGIARRRLNRAMFDQVLEDQVESNQDAQADVAEAQTASSEQLEQQMEFLGFVALEDPLRPDVPAAVDACQKAGLRVIMITGDHPETARYVALEAGLFRRADSEIILGHQLEYWSETQLQLALSQKEIAFARVKADHKLRIVEALQRKKEIVAVTGDGVNDAPALRRANVGLAMGLCGTDVARESSDIILLDDNFATIVDAIREGRGIFLNIRKFITYILASNVPEAVPYILFVLLPIPLPLTILQILAIDLGTDLIPALGLGTDPPANALTEQPPRSPGAHLIDKNLVIRAYLWLGLIEATAAMACFFFVLWNAGWSWGAQLDPNSTLARQATTATLSTVVLMQIVNVFLCRADNRETRQSLPRNKLILVGVVLEILFICAILYQPQLKEILKTEAPPLNFLAVGAFFMAIFVVLEQLRIRLTRKGQPMDASEAQGT